MHNFLESILDSSSFEGMMPMNHTLSNPKVERSIPKTISLDISDCKFIFEKLLLGLREICSHGVGKLNIVLRAFKSERFPTVVIH